MPSKYQPTGRPPGRPAKSLVERLGIKDVPARLSDTTSDRRFMPMDAICPDCFPEGWPATAGPQGTNCQHGTWVRRL